MPCPFPEIIPWQEQSKTRKITYETFLALSSFTGFLYFVPVILPSYILNFVIF